MGFLDSLSPMALAELREFVREEIAAALRQHEERRRWLTVEQTATYLGTTPKAIRGRIERGTLAVKRNGRALLIDREALDAQLAG